ncbi:hypothetical protein D3C71_77130 [compost metagenome]
MVKLKAGPKTFAAKRAAKQAEKNERLLITSMSPHLSLELFQKGQASQENWEVVCFRVSLGVKLAELYFDEECVEYLGEVELDLRQIYVHAIHHNVWTMTDEEYGVFRSALNLTDQLFELTTTGEQMPAWIAAANQMNLMQDPSLSYQLRKSVGLPRR